MEDISWTGICIIAGIVAIIIIIIVIGCVCCYIKKARRRRQNTEVRSGKRKHSNGGNIRYHKDTTSNTLDLHGHSVKSARTRVADFLSGKKQGYCNQKKTASIITGKGNHSRDGRPVLKPVVQNHLRKNGYKHKVDPKNAGRIIVDYCDIV